MFNRNKPAEPETNRGADAVQAAAEQPAATNAAPAEGTNEPAPQDTIVGTLAEDAVGKDADGNDITIKAGEEVIVNAADIVEAPAAEGAALPKPFDPTKGISNGVGAAVVDSNGETA